MFLVTRFIFNLFFPNVVCSVVADSSPIVFSFSSSPLSASSGFVTGTDGTSNANTASSPSNPFAIPQLSAGNFSFSSSGSGSHKSLTRSRKSDKKAAKRKVDPSKSSGSATKSQEKGKSRTAAVFTDDEDEDTMEDEEQDAIAPLAPNPEVDADIMNSLVFGADHDEPPVRPSFNFPPDAVSTRTVSRPFLASSSTSTSAIAPPPEVDLITMPMYNVEIQAVQADQAIDADIGSFVDDIPPDADTLCVRTPPPADVEGMTSSLSLDAVPAGRFEIVFGQAPENEDEESDSEADLELIATIHEEVDDAGTLSLHFSDALAVLGPASNDDNSHDQVAVAVVDNPVKLQEESFSCLVDRRIVEYKARVPCPYEEKSSPRSLETGRVVRKKVDERRKQKKAPKSKAPKSDADDSLLLIPIPDFADLPPYLPTRDSLALPPVPSKDLFFQGVEPFVLPALPADSEVDQQSQAEGTTEVVSQIPVSEGVPAPSSSDPIESSPDPEQCSPQPVDANPLAPTTDDEPVPAVDNSVSTLEEPQQTSVVLQEPEPASGSSLPVATTENEAQDLVHAQDQDQAQDHTQQSPQAQPETDDLPAPIPDADIDMDIGDVVQVAHDQSQPQAPSVVAVPVQVQVPSNLPVPPVDSDGMDVDPFPPSLTISHSHAPQPTIHPTDAPGSFVSSYSSSVPYNAQCLTSSSSSSVDNGPWTTPSPKHWEEVFEAIPDPDNMLEEDLYRLREWLWMLSQQWADYIMLPAHLSDILHNRQDVRMQKDVPACDPDIKMLEPTNPLAGLVSFPCAIDYHQYYY
ncbi:hypothetical protein D9613_008660 [Agrocybe pediades]|uniref:Uncharacterized protein n=1 Tax=Agrocybe pediades TaxID=84607 RepID=A0A8H4VQL0_9AGAR|nr:hypothetical protein D9613_008660 [Agrocybe pediades]